MIKALFSGMTPWEIFEKNDLWGMWLKRCDIERHRHNRVPWIPWTWSWETPGDSLWPFHPQTLEVTNNHLKGNTNHHPKKVTKHWCWCCVLSFFWRFLPFFEEGKVLGFTVIDSRWFLCVFFPPWRWQLEPEKALLEKKKHLLYKPAIFGFHVSFWGVFFSAPKLVLKFPHQTIRRCRCRREIVPF